jgi:prepilin-type N-terminal cleavage/methylation domain-containing protein
MDYPRTGLGRAQHGFSALELLAVVGIMALMLAVSLPGLTRYYAGYQISSAATMIESMIQQARMGALKEKNTYRVVVRDEHAATPNTIELQRREGGLFVTVPGEVRAVPGAVRILGTIPTDSVNSVTVNTRGECTTGTVYVSAEPLDSGVVTIASTCFTNAS